MEIGLFLILAIAFSTGYFLLVMYFFIGWLRLPSRAAQGNTPAAKTPFVSIIIPVRNEADNIADCLKCIFAQNYPANLFEVVVIDDYSTDSTLRLAREFNRSNLLTLNLQEYLGNTGEYTPNKKKAIALGIKNSRGELIITTDGDCITGQNWLATMVSYYTQNSYKLITGPVMVKPAKTPLAWFQQLDVLNMVGIAGATISNNFPTMCNGANLMYSKQVFHQVEGFKGNHDIPTGDDIFLMHKIDSRYPGSIGFVKNYEACVFTKPEKSLAALISQRVRWLSKSRRFSDVKVTLVLVFAYLFNLLIVIAAIKALNFTPAALLSLAILTGTKFFADFIFDISVAWFFKKLVLLLLLPVIEILHIVYVVVIGALSLSGKYRWRDRLVK
jgi:cellulose synthase/poly-beta-1,6-N-acetylglucosamine synthase-like glycosyltransferase